MAALCAQHIVLSITLWCITGKSSTQKGYNPILCCLQHQNCYGTLSTAGYHWWLPSGKGAFHPFPPSMGSNLTTWLPYSAARPYMDALELHRIWRDNIRWQSLPWSLLPLGPNHLQVHPPSTQFHPPPSSTQKNLPAALWGYSAPAVLLGIFLGLASPMAVRCFFVTPSTSTESIVRLLAAQDRAAWDTNHLYTQ